MGEEKKFKLNVQVKCICTSSNRSQMPETNNISFKLDSSKKKLSMMYSFILDHDTNKETWI